MSCEIRPPPRTHITCALRAPPPSYSRKLAYYHVKPPLTYSLTRSLTDSFAYTCLSTRPKAAVHLRICNRGYKLIFICLYIYAGHKPFISVYSQTSVSQQYGRYEFQSALLLASSPTRGVVVGARFTPGFIRFPSAIMLAAGV